MFLLRKRSKAIPKKLILFTLLITLICAGGYYVHTTDEVGAANDYNWQDYHADIIEGSKDAIDYGKFASLLPEEYQATKATSLFCKHSYEQGYIDLSSYKVGDILVRTILCSIDSIKFNFNPEPGNNSAKDRAYMVKYNGEIDPLGINGYFIDNMYEPLDKFLYGDNDKKGNTESLFISNNKFFNKLYILVEGGISFDQIINNPYIYHSIILKEKILNQQYILTRALKTQLSCLSNEICGYETIMPYDKLVRLTELANKISMAKGLDILRKLEGSYTPEAVISYITPSSVEVYDDLSTTGGLDYYLGNDLKGNIDEYNSIMHEIFERYKVHFNGLSMFCGEGQEYKAGSCEKCPPETYSNESTGFKCEACSVGYTTLGLAGQSNCTTDYSLYDQPTEETTEEPAEGPTEGPTEETTEETTEGQTGITLIDPNNGKSINGNNEYGEDFRWNTPTTAANNQVYSLCFEKEGMDLSSFPCCFTVESNRKSMESTNWTTVADDLDVTSTDKIYWYVTEGTNEATKSETRSFTLSMLEESTELEDKLAAADKALAEAKAAADKALAEAKAAEQALRLELEARLEGEKAKAEGLSERVASLATALEEANALNDSVVLDRDALITDLEGQLGEAETERDQAASNIESLEDRLLEFNSERDAMRDDNLRLSAELESSACLVDSVPCDIFISLTSEINRLNSECIAVVESEGGTITCTAETVSMEMPETISGMEVTLINGVEYSTQVDIADLETITMTLEEVSQETAFERFTNWVAGIFTPYDVVRANDEDNTIEVTYTIIIEEPVLVEDTVETEETVNESNVNIPQTTTGAEGIHNTNNTTINSPVNIDIDNNANNSNTNNINIGGTNGSATNGYGYTQQYYTNQNNWNFQNQINSIQNSLDDQLDDNEDLIEELQDKIDSLINALN